MCRPESWHLLQMFKRQPFPTTRLCLEKSTPTGWSVQNRACTATIKSKYLLNSSNVPKECEEAGRRKKQGGHSSCPGWGRGKAGTWAFLAEQQERIKSCCGLNMVLPHQTSGWNLIPKVTAESCGVFEKYSGPGSSEFMNGLMSFLRLHEAFWDWIWSQGNMFGFMRLD